MRTVLIAVIAAMSLAAAPATQPDTSWREAAEQRIEKIRKADLAVTVVDSAGKPLAGADVTVAMKRHAFGFGTAVNASIITADDEFSRKYREQIVKLFNKVVTENDLKWPNWEGAHPQYTHEKTLAGLRWLKAQGLTIRGHNLLWPSWQWSPKDLKALADKPDAMRKRIRDHIVDICAATKDLCDEWDVINEPVSRHNVIDVFGDDAMVDWFKLAREYVPGCKLYVNDFNILENDEAAYRDRYAQIVQFLIDRGAPIDGIGLQCHFGKLTPMDEVLRRIDRFAKFGKDLQVTEFDIDITDEKVQADYTRDFYTAAFSHPAITGVMMWGFIESRHWRPHAAIMRADWTLKPNGEVYRDLVFHRWWTNQNGKTNANGQLKLRGFLGDYEISAKAVNRAGKCSLTLDAAGKNERVMIK